MRLGADRAFAGPDAIAGGASKSRRAATTGRGGARAHAARRVDHGSRASRARAAACKRGSAGASARADVGRRRSGFADPRRDFPETEKEDPAASAAVGNSSIDRPVAVVSAGYVPCDVKAAERYAAIVQAGGWPTDIPALRPGAIGAAVAKLRKRLSIEGDLGPTSPREGPAAKIWSAELTNAVKRFQERMGLRKTGIVSGATLKAINVPAEVRHTQLAASAQRLSQIANFEFGDRYVVVNLPSTSVEAVENGVVAHRYVAIVGDPEHPSPEIAAHISVINLNPTWTVPTSIIKKEIIPKMQKDPGYLTRSKIRILDGAGNEINPRSVNWSSDRATNYILRQDSGAGNSLGSIRIGMPNKLAVYMHDTPSKRLFGADYRFLSHGCVRVQGVYDYAEWLLQGTPAPDGGAWTKAALLAKQKDGERDDIKLTKAVPVIWVYLTGWANGDGVANFRNDVYGVDVAAEASAQADVKDIDTAPAANFSTPAPNVSRARPEF